MGRSRKYCLRRKLRKIKKDKPRKKLTELINIKPEEICDNWCLTSTGYFLYT